LLLVTKTPQNDFSDRPEKLLLQKRNNNLTLFL